VALVLPVVPLVLVSLDELLAPWVALVLPVVPLVLVSLDELLAPWVALVLPVVPELLEGPAVLPVEPPLVEAPVDGEQPTTDRPTNSTDSPAVRVTSPSPHGNSYRRWHALAGKASGGGPRLVARTAEAPARRR
jgi:hypothetical protein